MEEQAGLFSEGDGRLDALGREGDVQTTMTSLDVCRAGRSLDPEPTTLAETWYWQLPVGDRSEVAAEAGSVKANSNLEKANATTAQVQRVHSRSNEAHETRSH